MTDKVQNIVISKINILNPRERNKQIAGEIKKNIEDVGLKRPITVTRKPVPVDGYEYDLVCGQGRLEAYIANEQTTIPAVVIDVNEEDALIMSLVENIARKNYQPFELFKSVKRLYDEGYSAADIAAKIGLAREYMYQIIKLLENGEERLLNAVEMNKIPLNVAIQIIETPESEIQNVLQDAYEQNLIKGNKIPQIQKLLEIRKRDGKYMRVQKIPKKMSPADLHKIYEQEIERKRLLIRKAEKVENALIILTESFKKLLHNENFINLLKAENLERVPEFILEKVNQNV
ncbi:MAG: plasmid partitioning protein RepB C-terminal domain-containing protein [Alphaproteobacteria bacterium]|nr:plasmid partitioning protein RepB C-terminal domain-containing protein [Alphaproteobacteria bacterium]